MISRRGLRSRSHPPTPYPAESDFVGDPARKATELLARVRAAVTEATEAGRSWHPVFETLRLQGGDIWRALAPDARRRVARHLRPFWDAHRFRLAPQLDAQLAAKLADGSLVLRKARLGAVARRGEALAVELRDLRRKAATTETFERIVRRDRPGAWRHPARAAVPGRARGAGRARARPDGPGDQRLPGGAGGRRERRARRDAVRRRAAGARRLRRTDGPAACRLPRAFRRRPTRGGVERGQATRGLSRISEKRMPVFGRQSC